MTLTYKMAGIAAAMLFVAGLLFYQVEADADVRSSRVISNIGTMSWCAQGDTVCDPVLGKFTHSTRSNIVIVKVTRNGKVGNAAIFDEADVSSLSFPIKKSNVLLIKQSDVTTVKDGDTITFKLTYANRSAEDIMNVRISDTIPLGTTYVSWSATSPNTFSNKKLTWDVGTVKAGKSGSVSFKVTVDNSLRGGGSGSGSGTTGGSGATVGGTGSTSSGAGIGSGSGGSSGGAASGGTVTSSNAVTCGQNPTWTTLATPFDPKNNIETHAMTVGADGTVYVGTPTLGVFKSSDHGLTWTAINTGLPLPLKPVSALGINAKGELLVGLNGFKGSASAGYAYRYSGGTWKQASGITTNLKVSDFAVDASGNVLAVTAFNADVYRSHDGGDTYTKIATNIATTGGGAPGALWVIKVAKDGSVYAGGELTSGLLKSSDGGSTWQSIGLASPTYSNNLNLIAFNTKGEVLANRALGAITLLRYQNGAWATSKGLPAYVLIEGLGTNASGDIFAATFYNNKSFGIYCSKAADGGTNYQAFNDANSASNFSALLVDKSGYVYAFTKGLTIRTAQPTQ